MTKLEQKLIELGYKQSLEFPFKYYKWVGNAIKRIQIDNGNRINYKHSYIQYAHNRRIKTQQDIDNLQQAFNELQKDLGILKECEK